MNPTTTISKATVMHHAWRILKSTGVSISEALRQAWHELKLAFVRLLMQCGFITITFRKVDGTICTKRATRRLDLIPDPDKPKGGGAAGSAAVLAFYSETDAAWRSFRTDNLLSFKAA